ncbi:hypothetical protein BT93_L0469 [Corymbia citriodora subsp. variegata]|uniref:Uncharacterized protein n=1 Tax=Corymbia citriodora subsp. variegata TaxID=360336 RepID=A0A8T0CQY3_CORYI|nr:hypothetical protein BT93_L0469 [Corymbia citriodora subsp. variegata]
MADEGAPIQESMNEVRESIRRVQQLISERIKVDLKRNELDRLRLRQLQQLRRPQHHDDNRVTDLNPHSREMTLRKVVSCLTLLLLFLFMNVMLCGCIQIKCV